MICSKINLGSELDIIKQLLIENGYRADVLHPCIKQKLANFAAEKTFYSGKCPPYLKLPWIGNVSSKFENQVSKAITSCFYAVKPRVVYNTRVMLPASQPKMLEIALKMFCNQILSINTLFVAIHPLYKFFNTEKILCII